MAKNTALRIASATPDLVDRGCHLTAQVKVLSTELDPIKDQLRREAGLQLGLGVSEIELEGKRGAVSITYPKPSYQVDETRIHELKALLGPRFTEFVTEKVSYSTTTNYEALYPSLDVSIRTKVVGLVDVKASTPRVAFGKIVGS